MNTELENHSTLCGAKIPEIGGGIYYFKIGIMQNQFNSFINYLLASALPSLGTRKRFTDS